MKKIIVFLNGKHSKSVLHVQTQTISFPFLSEHGEPSCEHTVIFAADNGFKRVLHEKIKYSKLYLFGDFDSLSVQHLKKAKTSKNVEVNVFPKEKNLSDFACILDHLRSHFSTADPFLIEVYGGLGFGRDHEYANLKEAEHFLEHCGHGGIIVFQDGAILSTQSFAIRSKRKRNFSIFCSPKCEFEIQNALYSGKFSLTRPSHGLSNCICKSPLLIERTNASHAVMMLTMRNSSH